jgi:hypothetical protein
LRFNRDRRGYETTAVVHVGGRRRGKGQRVLYWFRTPPGVRVGRAPIDEAAIRLLEQHNPDVEFDWTRILKDPPAGDAPARRDGRDGRGGREGRDRRDRSSQRSHGSNAPIPGRRSQEPPVGPEPAPPARIEPVEPVEFVQLVEPVQLVDLAETAVPAEPRDAGEPADAREPVPSLEPTEADRTSASFARLGAEGLVRLRARYAEVMARIAERPLDEEAREELKQRAERLNPDAWVTADEVSAALEQYETVFEGLRAVVGRHPRRRRGR